MLSYIIKRVIAIIFVCIGVAIFIFTILYFVPGDPAVLILGNNATPEALAELRDKLGLSQSYIVRLFNFLGDVFLRFDFGTSYFTQTSVTSEIFARFPRTLLLAGISTVLGMVIGVPLGVTAATHQNHWQDRLCMVLAVVFFCVPQFWLAIMLVILFSVTLGWLPAFGVGGIEYYIIPCIALMCSSFAMVARQTRSSMLEVIRSDYVITARSQGFSERRIIYGTALPNGLMPIITLLGTSFVHALGGTIIIETVFSMPGLGLYLRNAISQRDYPIVQGTVVFLSIVFCIVLLLVDILYAVVDPRVKDQLSGGSGNRRRRRRASDV